VNHVDPLSIEKDVLHSETNLDQILHQIQRENRHLSIRNVSTRAAFLQRMLEFLFVLESSKCLFNESYLSTLMSARFTFFDFIIRKAFTVYSYIKDSVVTVFNAIRIFLNFIFYWVNIQLINATQVNIDLYLSAKEKLIAETNSSFNKSIQAIKIATAITLCSAFVVFAQVTSFYQNGLWLAFSVAIIRQENVSSSFLMAYQRLEGTVIGALYGVVVYTAFKCDQTNNECGPSIAISVIILWIAVCSLFREGPRHGYAAAVASFTPMIVFIS
jgi:hypothetical protein